MPLSVIYALDNAGRRTYIKLEGSGMLREFSYEYNEIGQLISETTPEGLVTYYTYTSMGQVETISGAVYWQAYEYDPQGRVTKLTTKRSDQDYQITTFEYDNRGRLSKKTYPDNSFETYTYFGDGRLDTATNCRNQTIELTYDQFNNLASISAGALQQYFMYNERNQLIKITDEDNYIHSLEYDSSGRLASENFSDIPNTEIRYVYDRFLRRQSICFAEHHINYDYDDISRLSSVDYGQISFQYTRVPWNNNIAKITASKGNTIIYEQPRTYGPLWDLTSIGDTEYTLNRDGIRTGATLPDDKTWAYSYDTQNQISTGELTDGTTTIFNQSYSYDQMGNHLGASFLRDADGNTLDVNGYTCTYDALNRLSTLTQNRVKFKLKYDYSSRLIKLEKYTGTTLDYTDRYVYDGWNLLATYRDNKLTKFHTWGEDLSGTMTGAGGVGGLLAEDNEAGVFLPQYDGNGNIISYLDESATEVASYTYDPFGNILISSGDMVDSLTFKFSTKPFMPFNLYYYGYRFYNPATCTWLTKDPIGDVGGVNLHAFALNNAVNYVDFIGLIVEMFDFRTNLLTSIEKFIEPFETGWRNLSSFFTKNKCCGKELYNPATHCCIDEKDIFAFKPSLTGVVIYKEFSKDFWSFSAIGIPDHAYLEIDGYSFGAYSSMSNRKTDGSSAPGGSLESYGNFMAYIKPHRADIRSYEIESRASRDKYITKEQVELSPCEYHIEDFKKCLRGKAGILTSYYLFGGNCISIIKGMIADCKKENKRKK